MFWLSLRCFYQYKPYIRRKMRLWRSVKEWPSCNQFSSASSTSIPHQTLSVIIRSKSRDIFTNLALEDCLYNLRDDENRVLFWYNKPCVVIGRHQNPWLEANIPFLRRNNIPIVRRQSGGGTVYHDEGNLNISFLTSKENHNRKRNLTLICRALKQLEVNASINERDDIVLNNVKKISGTAAKLSRDGAYHHCTLLVDVNSEYLHGALAKKSKSMIQTNATRSVRSPVENVGQLYPNISLTSVQDAIIHQLGHHQPIMDIDPDSQPDLDRIGIDYSCLQETRQSLMSWDWIFGKSPKFSLEHKMTTGENGVCQAILRVNQGRVDALELVLAESDEENQLTVVRPSQPPTLQDLASWNQKTLSSELLVDRSLNNWTNFQQLLSELLAFIRNELV